MKMCSSGMTMGAGSRAALVLLVLMLSSLSWSARPLLNDDARVVDRGDCQIESWSVRSANLTEYWLLPACGVGAGTEIAAGLQQVRRTSEHDRLGLVQIKYILKSLEPAGVGSALTLGAQSSPLGTSYYLNTPLSWLSRTERTAVHLNLGWATVAGATGFVRSGGIGVEQHMAGPLWLIAERHHPRPASPLWQAGVRWWIAPAQLQLDATVGSQAVRGDSSRFFTLGLRWIFTGSS